MRYDFCRRSSCLFSFIVMIIALPGSCTGIDYMDASKKTMLELRVRAVPAKVRSLDPEESLVSDINLFLFNKDGMLEEQKYMELEGENEFIYSTKWIEGMECHAYACANIGYPMANISDLDALMKYRYYIAYPDEYSRGMPMSGKSVSVPSYGSGEDFLDIDLYRTMAKVSVSMDRSALRRDVRLNVKSVKIGCSPRSVSMFRPSKAEGSSDIFKTGFSKSLAEVDVLNVETSVGRTGELSMYMLENMQGDLLPDVEDERDNVIDASESLASVCSYVEIATEYMSDSLQTLPGDCLYYRFYLGKGPGNFDVERNWDYHVVVRPEGDGLGDDGWRVDKGELSPKLSLILPH